MRFKENTWYSFTPYKQFPDSIWYMKSSNLDGYTSCYIDNYAIENNKDITKPYLHIENKPVYVGLGEQFEEHYNYTEVSFEQLLWLNECERKKEYFPFEKFNKPSLLMKYLIYEKLNLIY